MTRRLPIVNADDGTWGDLLRDFLMKEHYETNTGSLDPANGGHKTITIRAGTATAGTAPLKFTSGTLLTTPEAGAIEFNGGFYMTLSGNARTAIVGADTAQTLTNKTLSAPVLNGTVTGTYTLGGTPSFPSSIVTTTGAQTLTNKTINLSNNTLSTTIAQLNTAVSDADVETTGHITPIAVSTSTAASTPAKVATTDGGSYVPAVGDLIAVTFVPGTSASSMTLQIDGGSTYPIWLGGAAASSSVIVALNPANSVSLMYFDGSHWMLLGNMDNADGDTRSQGLTVVTGTTQTMAANVSYIANNDASQVAFTTDASFSAGNSQIVMGLGAGGWRVTAASGDNIIINGVDTGAGGYIEAIDAHARIEMVGSVSNATWQVLSWSGRLNVNGTELGLSTGTIELGHASDTTLSRSAAGRLAVEGVDVPTVSSADILSNKTLSAPTVTGTTSLDGTLNYTPDSGNVLTFDGTPVITRHLGGQNKSIGIGGDDTVLIGAGESRGIMASNVNLASESVEIGAESGVNIHVSTDNWANWANRKTTAFTSTGITWDGNTVWHAGNDGAGSGLDADTLDGQQASAFVTLTGSEVLTNKTISGSNNTLSNIPQSAITNLATDIGNKADVSVVNAGDVLRSTPINTHPESSGFSFIPMIHNDISFNHLRGGSVVVTRNGSPVSNPSMNWFMNGGHTSLIPTASTDTFVIEVTLCQTFSYGTYYGLFMNDSFIAHNVIIEVFYSGAWTQIYNGTSTSGDPPGRGLHWKQYGGNGSNPVSKVRYTLTDIPNLSSGVRINSLFVIGYASPLATVGFLPRSGGNLYGTNTAPPVLSASGGDADIDLRLTSKGTGTVKANGVQVADVSSSQTLTNKTINAPDNTITNIAVSNLATSAVVTASETIASNNNDTTLPTSAAVKSYVDSNGSAWAQVLKASLNNTVPVYVTLSGWNFSNTLGQQIHITTHIGSGTAGAQVYLEHKQGTMDAVAAFGSGISGLVSGGASELAWWLDTTNSIIYLRLTMSTTGNDWRNTLIEVANGPVITSSTSTTAPIGASWTALTSSAVLVARNAAETLTNKTLSSPTFSGSYSFGGTPTWPTFNQNTTGSAATLTTARTFQTNLASTSTASFDGSANVTPGVTGTLPVGNGGTGRTTATTAYGLIAAGTTATGAQQTIAPGASGQFLKSAGASALASFASITAADISDSTATGRSVLTATDAAAARTAIGAGTGNGDVTLSGAQTLTNKRVQPRVTSISSSATPSINTDNCDAVTITALATNITSMTSGLSGTPVNFQKLLIRIKDDGTARSIAWGASFEDGTVALPTTTVAGKTLLVGLIYDSVDAKWAAEASGSRA